MLRSLQLGPTLLPIGKKSIHERVESWPMTTLEKMAKFMDDHVFETLGRIESQTGVDADPSSRRLAAPPARSHIPVCDLTGLHPHHGLPFLYERRSERGNNIAPEFLFLVASLFCLALRGSKDLCLLASNPRRLLRNELPYARI